MKRYLMILLALTTLVATGCKKEGTLTSLKGTSWEGGFSWDEMGTSELVFNTSCQATIYLESGEELTFPYTYAEGHGIMDWSQYPIPRDTSARFHYVIFTIVNDYMSINGYGTGTNDWFISGRFERKS